MMMESKVTIAMCLYSSMVETGDQVTTVQRTEIKEVENGFLKLSYETQRGTQ